MLNFKECIVVPKDEFIHMTEQKNHGISSDLSKIKKEEEVKVEEQVGGGKEKRKHQSDEEKDEAKKPKKNDMYKDAGFIKLLQDRGGLHSSLNIPKSALLNSKKTTNNLLVPETNLDNDNIIKMFPQSDKYKLERILFLIKQKPGVLEWDPQTLELIAFNKIYPRSNIIEILSYLIGMAKQGYVSENHYMKELHNRSIPQDTEIFLQAFEHILGMSNTKLAQTNILDNSRVKEIEKLFDLPFTEAIKQFQEEHSRHDNFSSPKKDQIWKAQNQISLKESMILNKKAELNGFMKETENKINQMKKEAEALTADYNKDDNVKKTLTRKITQKSLNIEDLKNKMDSENITDEELATVKEELDETVNKKLDYESTLQEIETDQQDRTNELANLSNEIKKEEESLQNYEQQQNQTIHHLEEEVDHDKKKLQEFKNTSFEKDLKTVFHDQGGIIQSDSSEEEEEEVDKKYKRSTPQQNTEQTPPTFQIPSGFQFSGFPHDESANFGAAAAAAAEPTKLFPVDFLAPSPKNPEIRALLTQSFQQKDPSVSKVLMEQAGRKISHSLRKSARAKKPAKPYEFPDSHKMRGASSKRKKALSKKDSVDDPEPSSTYAGARPKTTTAGITFRKRKKVSPKKIKSPTSSWEDQEDNNEEQIPNTDQTE